MKGCGGADQDLEGQKVQTAGVLESSGFSYLTLQFNRTVGGWIWEDHSLAVSPVVMSYCKIFNKNMLLIHVSPERNHLTGDITNCCSLLFHVPLQFKLLDVLCSPLGELATGADVICVLKCMNKFNLVSN